MLRVVDRCGSDFCVLCAVCVLCANDQQLFHHTVMLLVTYYNVSLL